MNIKKSIIILLLYFVSLFICAQEYHYDVYYSYPLFNFRTGEASISTSYQDSYTKITAKGNTLSSFDWFFKVSCVMTTLIDNEGLPYNVNKEFNFNGSIQDENYTVNKRLKKISIEKDSIDKINNKLILLKKNILYNDYFYDFLSLYQIIRNYDFNSLKINDKINIVLFNEEEFSKKYFIFLGKEYLIIDKKKIQCFKIKISTEKGFYFSNNEAIIVFIQNSKDRTPLQIDVEIRIGNLNFIYN